VSQGQLTQETLSTRTMPIIVLQGAKEVWVTCNATNKPIRMDLSCLKIKLKQRSQL